MNIGQNCVVDMAVKTASTCFLNIRLSGRNLLRNLTVFHHQTESKREMNSVLLRRFENRKRIWLFWCPSNYTFLIKTSASAVFLKFEGQYVDYHLQLSTPQLSRQLLGPKTVFRKRQLSPIIFQALQTTQRGKCQLL